MKKYAAIVLFVLLTQAGQSYAALPNWSATPANYELSATMTATLYLDFVAVEGEGNLVGAFVGEECRGVASPIRVLDSWVYFLTIFSNSNGEIIRLKAYVAAQDRILNAEETISFSANGAYGDPSNPLALHTILNYDFPPSVSGIPDQKIEAGNRFASIDLKNYLVEKDGHAIVWSYSSDNFFLTVAIDAQGVATITPTRTDWTGTGNITFTATDQTDKKLTGSDSAVFTALPPDHPPVVKTIPNQTIGIAGTFAPILFAEYLTENDGDQVAWSYRFRTADKEGTRPTWAVQPVDYELSMTVTATVRSRGEPTAGGDFLLGAFAGAGALEECRGVATPVEVLGSWVYFMTVYSNSFGEEIRFRFFDSRTREVLPVREKISFAPNSAHGSPTNPTQLGAGYLYVEMGSNETQVGLVDESWNGTEAIEFIVADLGTLNGYTDTAAVTFNVLANHQPLVTGIPDQIVEVGSGFAAFDLDSYLTELDGDQIIWSAAGNSALRVDVDAGNEVTVAPFDPAWTGRDTVVFTAMDLFSLLIYAIGEKNAFTNSDTVVFGIVPKDHPPVLADVPDQTVGLLGSFVPIPLNGYLTEVDGDQTRWSYEFPPPAQPAASPSWAVQPAAYELTMSIAAVVTSQGQKKGAGGHLLGAFVGDECRGIANPVAALDSWVYFLVVYANQNGETMRFRFFDADVGEVLPVAQTKSFQANATHGDPQHPDGFDAGLLLVNIGDDGKAAISIVDLAWSGSEELNFSARDVGTIHGYAVTDRVTFTVLPDHQPLVRAIPHQTVEQGTPFQSFDLDAYLEEEDGDPVRWSAASATNLQVSIDAANRASVTPSIPTWSGGETVTFTATDQTPNRFAGSGSVRFTVQPPDHAPVVGDVPDRSIRKNRSFAPFDLDNFLTEIDGNPIGWSFAFPAANPPVGVPAWSVAAVDYELSMSATVAVNARGQSIAGEGHRLAVFAGDQCRGVASPVFTLDRWLFFLNIYANGGGEEISFQFYDAGHGAIFPGREKLTFAANAVHGSPSQPFALNAGYLKVGIDAENQVAVEVIDDSWIGSETVVFTATDQGTTHGYGDSTWVTLSVLPPLTIYGDVTGDETVNSLDAAWILQHVVDLRGLSGADSVVADVSANAAISSFDASLVLQRIVGKIGSFPAESGGSGKLVRMAGRAWLGAVEDGADGRFVVPVLVEGEEEVVAGEMELILPEELAEVTVRTGELTDGFLLVSSARNGRLRAAFAGIEGRGESGTLLELVFDAEPAGWLEALRLERSLQLERVGLNEGRAGIASSALPLRNRLWQNYPNPFNPETTVRFELIDSASVQLSVYALTGQRVRTLVDGVLAVGMHASVWDGRDDSGRAVASGMYLLRLETGNFRALQKMLLVR